MEGNAPSGTFDTFGTNPGVADSGVADTVRNAATSLTEKSRDALVAVKDTASELPDMVADRLEAGAEMLRPEHQPASARGFGTLVNATPVARSSDKLADGLQQGADWLRNADFDKMRSGIEQQVKDKPAQSLLIALGVGYLFGKAVRR